MAVTGAKSGGGQNPQPPVRDLTHLGVTVTARSRMVGVKIPSGRKMIDSTGNANHPNPGGAGGVVLLFRVTYRMNIPRVMTINDY